MYYGMISIVDYIKKIKIINYINKNFKIKKHNVNALNICKYLNILDIQYEIIYENFINIGTKYIIFTHNI